MNSRIRRARISSGGVRSRLSLAARGRSGRLATSDVYYGVAEYATRPSGRMSELRNTAPSAKFSHRLRKAFGHVFSAEGAAFTGSLGVAPQDLWNTKSISAESAIHFGCHFVASLALCPNRSVKSSFT